MEFLEHGDVVKTGNRHICRQAIDQCEIPNTVQGGIGRPGGPPAKQGGVTATNQECVILY
jgi:hypothetical protein